MRYIKQFQSFLNHNLIVEKTIDEIRTKIILFFFYSALFIGIIFLFIRMIEMRFDMVLISGLVVISYLFFIKLINKGYSQEVFIFASFLNLFIAFYEGYRLNIPIQTIIYFSILPAISVLLIKNNVVRVLYLITNIGLFIYLNILTQTEELSNVITFIIVVLYFFATIVIFIFLLEKQQRELVSAIIEKNNAIELLEDRNKDLLLFTNMMSHDLKAPLRSIKGFSSLLNKKLAKKENTTSIEKEYLKYVLDNADNMDVLIKDLLSYLKATTTSYELEIINLDTFIDAQTLAFQLEIRNNQLIIEKSNLGKVNANKNILKTVFQNLISNGMKYQPLDKPNHTPTIKISSEQEDNKTLIFLQDNGIGIKSEYLPELFTPFKRFHSASEYKGTGLGLSICKKMLQKIEGDIDIKESTENGTCFIITIPNNNVVEK